MGSDPHVASASVLQGGEATDVEMADLHWAEETATAFADEAAQMQIDSGGVPPLLLLHPRLLIQKQHRYNLNTDKYHFGAQIPSNVVQCLVAHYGVINGVPLCKTPIDIIGIADSDKR